MDKLEKEFYPIVEKWMKKTHHCFKTCINAGLQYSRADIIGIRDIGGDLTGEIETIIIEVKRGIEPFATAAGQTFGYTVYANRVYLADNTTNGQFSQDKIQIASHLGIGLISIDKNSKCSEVLSSPFYEPLTKLSTHLLDKLSLGKCQFCDSIFEIGENVNKRFSNLAREDEKGITKAAKNKKGFMFWNSELGNRKQKAGIRSTANDSVYDRRYLCSECVERFFGHLNSD